MRASPAKLQDGTWGAWVQSHRVDVGDTITIRSSKGKMWDAVVTEIVKQITKNGDELTLVRTHNDRDGEPPALKRGCSCTCEACSHCEHKVAGEVVPF